MKPRLSLLAAILLLAVLSALSAAAPARSRTQSLPDWGLQEQAIENKQLAEFDPKNDAHIDVSAEEKTLLQQMMPIVSLIGGAKDRLKDEEAVKQLNAIIEKNPRYSDAYILRATCSIAAGDTNYASMRQDIDSAIKLYSPDESANIYNSAAEMYSMRAKVDMLAGDLQQAMKDLDTALTTHPDDVNSIFNSGGVKPEENANPTALQKRDLDLLVARYPQDFRSYLYRGLFYFFFATFDEHYYTPTLSNLEQARRLNPGSALVNYFLGSVYWRRVLWTKAAWSDVSESGGYRDRTNAIALQYFRNALRLDPRFTDAYAQAAESLLEMKRYSEAIPYYDKVIELGPTRFGAYNDRGLAKSYVKDYYGAIGDFSQAITLAAPKNDSSLASTYENRAEANLKIGSYESAIEDYSSAIGHTFASQVFLMSLPQIRSIYPEFKDVPDNDLLEGLRQKYYPNMSQTDFSAQYLKNSKPFEDFILAGLYEERGNAYLAEGNFRKAASDFARAHHTDSTYAIDRWKTISTNSETEFSIDTQTLDFSGGNPVSLWSKSLRRKTGSYVEEQYQIDCSGREIKLISSIAYSPSGRQTSFGTEGDWQPIVPDTIGETLYKGMCQGK